MKIKADKPRIVFNIMGYGILLFFAIYCAVPFWLILSGSFTSESAIYKYGFQLFPKEFSLRAYETIFRNPDKIFKAYGVSIMITIIGALAGLFLVAMTAYVLYRKDFKYRNKIAFFIYFTTIFTGGLIPSYILMVRYLHLKDSYLALILPPLLNAMHIILMRNFMKSIPDSIVESAKIDGAGDFRIFIKLILPLSIPGLATIGLFLSLQYWNDWYHAMLYIDTRNRYPLQYLLYELIRSAEYLAMIMSRSSSVSTVQTPTESLKMATAIVVTGPIIFLYPAIQKYYVKGLTIGAVKG